MEQQQIIVQNKLIANIIISWCENKASEGVITFERSFASSSKFRFSTSTIESIFPATKSKSGYWKNGYSIFYEIETCEKGLFVSLISSKALLSNDEKYNSFLLSNGVTEDDSSVSVIKTWSLLPSGFKMDLVVKSLEHFLSSDLVSYEKELNKWCKNHNYVITEDEFYIEGAQKQVTSNRYERSAAARKECIAFHGAFCHICGFDYGEVYGQEFANKIEVHHIVPLSEIKQGYIVDPKHDLIPVCSNCHMILHSKKEGAYTPDEVRKLLKRK